MKFLPGAEMPELYGRYRWSVMFSIPVLRIKFALTSYIAFMLSVYHEGAKLLPLASFA